MYSYRTTQQTPFQSFVIINGVPHPYTTDEAGTLYFTLTPVSEPGVVEGTIASSEIIAENILEGEAHCERR